MNNTTPIKALTAALLLTFGFVSRHMLRPSIQEPQK
jgi:hypothetical protein